MMIATFVTDEFAIKTPDNSLLAALPAACFAALAILLAFQYVARTLSVVQRTWIQIALLAPIAAFAIVNDPVGILELSYFAVGVATAMGLTSMALSAWNTREHHPGAGIQARSSLAFPNAEEKKKKVSTAA